MAFESEQRADLKKFQKPVMLKDLLNSSSSNDFVSFPRCAPASCSSSTVRKLLEIDLGAGSRSSQGKMPMPPSRSGGSCAASALRRASETVINAVKQIPFYSVTSPPFSTRPEQTSSNLRRSLSQRLKRRFWKRKKTDAERRKSCSYREEEAGGGGDCKGSLQENSNSSCSWLESDCSSAQSSTGSSEYFGGNQGLFGKNDQLKPCSSRSTESGGAGEDSTVAETKGQEPQQSLQGIACLDDDKEQLSPVSVLDRHACDDEESPSPTSPINVGKRP
ncbi:hypothetical protein ACLOJK_005160 [Asimina triloba]